MSITGGLCYSKILNKLGKELFGLVWFLSRCYLACPVLHSSGLGVVVGEVYKKEKKMFKPWKNYNFKQRKREEGEKWLWVLRFS